jgi:hypothetical protein
MVKEAEEGAVREVEEALALAALMEDQVLRGEVEPEMDFALAAFGAVAAAASLEAAEGR